MGLIGVGVYLLVPKLDKEPPVTQKQATSSAITKKCVDEDPSDQIIECLPLTLAFSRNTGELIYISDSNQVNAKEIWLYDKGKLRKITKTSGKAGKYQLNSDGKKLYYIKNEVVSDPNGSDYFLGIELREVELQTGREKILVPRIKVEKEVYKRNLSDFDISHDGKKIAFVRGGLWILNLDTNKTTKIAQSTYYDAETTTGHSYSAVKWSPSDKFIATSWGGYETLGYDLINIESKKINLIEPGGFPPRYDFLVFVDDSKGIFINSIDSNKARIIEKDFSILKKKVLLDDLVGDEEFYNLGFSDLKYTSSQDRIYMIQTTTTIKKPSGTGSFFQSKIIYLERKSGSLSDLTSFFAKDVAVNNLTLTSDSEYLLFNVNDDIWILSTDEETKGMLLENANKPIVP